jgi:hypothetical protein
MLGLRFRNDAHMGSKNGQPAQSTTGVASSSCSHAWVAGAIHLRSGASGSMSPMASAKTGTVRTVPTQKRRVMSSNWGLASGSAVTVRGASAIPQIGHEPGAVRTTCGCIGQTYSVAARSVAATITGSRAMPHFGHAPGGLDRTSGCIGHV